MKTVFISGANRGLGFEFVRQYAAAGWRVIAGCRDPGRADALNALPNTQVVTLNVSDSQSIATAARAVSETTIDLLINNAGIYGSTAGGQTQSLDLIDLDVWTTVLRTNVMGPLALTRALLPVLSREAVIGILSSTLGSIAGNTQGGLYAYRSAKAAVNMVGRSLAADLKPRGIAVVLLHPGWVRTDMGGPRAPVSPVDSIAGMRQVLDSVTLASTGRFFGWDGAELAW
jgi:NAD(P)-dependent dehydrogenase (short-subunit alcohol dehydrogenase family)